MSPTARGAAGSGLAAVPAAAGLPLYFAVPEPAGALLVFYLFLVTGALLGARLAVEGGRGPVAFRFGLAFSIPGAVLPFSLLPADGAAVIASTAAAWGLALGAGAALGAFLAAPWMAASRSRARAALRAGSAFLVGGVGAGAAAPALVSALPGRGYFGAWAVAVIGGCALGGGLLRRSR